MLKRFTRITKDANGVEFRYIAYLNRDWVWRNGEMVQDRDDVYKAMGITAHTLKELREKIAQL